MPARRARTLLIVLALSEGAIGFFASGTPRLVSVPLVILGVAFVATAVVAVSVLRRDGLWPAPLLPLIAIAAATLGSASAYAAGWQGLRLEDFGGDSGAPWWFAGALLLFGLPAVAMAMLLGLASAVVAERLRNRRGSQAANSAGPGEP